LACGSRFTANAIARGCDILPRFVDATDESETQAAPTRPARARPLVELGAVSALCLAMGSMLGASALATLRTESTHSTASGGRRALSVNAVGVWREIPGHASVPSAAEWVAEAMATLDAERARAERPQGRRRASGGGAAASASPGVTSDHVPAGPAQGYVDGRATRITVTRLDGKPVEVRTALAFDRMRAAAARDGVTIRVVSGFRTMEHQQALYAAYRRGRGNLAARPGESNHQSGHALDLNTSSPGVLRWLQRNAQRFGFRRTVPSEAWHWEWW
jgi:D-alanyl-D-alanine carboxypeptidase